MKNPNFDLVRKEDGEFLPVENQRSRSLWLQTALMSILEKKIVWLMKKDIDVPRRKLGKSGWRWKMHRWMRQLKSPFTPAARRNTRQLWVCAGWCVGSATERMVEICPTSKSISPIYHDRLNDLSFSNDSIRTPTAFTGEWSVIEINLEWNRDRWLCCDMFDSLVCFRALRHTSGKWWNKRRNVSFDMCVCP